MKEDDGSGGSGDRTAILLKIRKVQTAKLEVGKPLPSDLHPSRIFFRCAELPPLGIPKVFTPSTVLGTESRSQAEETKGDDTLDQRL